MVGDLASARRDHTLGRVDLKCITFSRLQADVVNTYLCSRLKAWDVRSHWTLGVRGRHVVSYE